MCGLLFYLSNHDLFYKTFNEALALQKHRGPDNSAIFFNDKLVENFEQFSIKQLKDKKEQDQKNFFQTFLLVTIDFHCLIYQKNQTNLFLKKIQMIFLYIMVNFIILKIIVTKILTLMA